MICELDDGTPGRLLGSCSQTGKTAIFQDGGFSEVLAWLTAFVRKKRSGKHLQT